MSQETATIPQEFSIFEKNDETTRASTGKRLANYLIDLAVFYAILFLIGMALAVVSPATLAAIPENDPGFDIMDRLLSLLLYGIYMGIIETLFKGKSIGKFITRTRAVNIDGSPISAKTAFLRGLSRAVPFCAFSAFGTPCNPWQDRWTKTMVIDEKPANLLP